MIHALMRLALRPAGGRHRRWRSLLLVVGIYRFHSARYRGVSRPGAADGRGADAAQRAQRRRGREAGHGAAGISALSGMRDLQAMRSISLFGLSDIRCYFDWDSDYYLDRTETINQLHFVTLPPGITRRHLAGKSDRRDLSLHGRKSRPRSDQARRKSRTGSSRNNSRPSGRNRCLRLRRADQAIPCRCRSAEADLLQRSALDR